VGNTNALQVFDARDADLTGIGVSLRLPDSGTKRPDVENDVLRFFGKLGLIQATQGVEFGICAYNRRDFTVEEMEQHKRSAELLFAVDDDFIMPVAPNIAGVDRPDLAKAFAIRVRRSEGVLFDPGAWHWVPYPTGKEKSFALVGFALDTPANDMSLHAISPALRMLV
jgi:ureidoglycolate hydrolase